MNLDILDKLMIIDPLRVMITDLEIHVVNVRRVSYDPILNDRPHISTEQLMQELDDEEFNDIDDDELNHDIYDQELRPDHV